MNHNILVITRVSRIEFIEDIIANVKSFAMQLLKANTPYNIVWGVGVDMNKVPADTPRRIANLLEANGGLPDRMTYIIKPAITNSSLYASNIANVVWEDYLKNHSKVLLEEPDYSKSFVYLLDDDNKIHPELARMLCITDYYELIVGHQHRLRDGIIKMNEGLCGDNCLGWIDSAQFLIRQDILKELGGYENGYCIDGLTIKKYFDTSTKPDMFVFDGVMSYYNYFTELKPNNMG